MACASLLCGPGCGWLTGTDSADGSGNDPQAARSSESGLPPQDPAGDPDDGAANPDAKANAKPDPLRPDPNTPPTRPQPLGDPTTKPIVLTEVEVTSKNGLFGAGALEIKAKGTLGDKIDSATYVQAKAVCKDGGRFLADTGFVNADYRKPLQDHEIGETAELSGRFFSQGATEIAPPCQIEFRLAGAGGGISIPLETACYGAEGTTVGPCSPPVAAPSMSTPGGKPMRALDVKVEPPGSFGSPGGINASYVLEFKETQDNGTKITVKAACRVGEVTFVDVGVTTLMAGPFKFEAGEAVGRSSSLFFNPAFGFAEPPKLCDFEVSTWKQDKGSFGVAEQIVLANACYREGRMTTGPCDPDGLAPPEAGPVDADSLEVDEVMMEVVEPYGSKGDRFQLKIQADALVKKPVEEFSSINTKITCKVGKTARVETAYVYGVELHYLRPGETTRMSGTTFTSAPMDRRPQWCEAEFEAGQRFSPTARENVLLGKWCLRKGSTKPGKC